MAIIQGTSKSSAAGYSIDQSIRFNFSDGAHMLRTPSTASNRRTWTWSLWVKRSGLGNPGGPNQVHQLFGVGAGSCLRFTSTDALRLETPAGNHTFVTSQLFRDTSAWYHIVLAFDSTQATDTDRRKLYVNGSQVTDFSSTTFTGLAQNAEWDINSTSQHQIAKSNLADYFGGYLAELNFVDGSALAPTDFGETNADTGQWVPVRYAGSYGTNGFYLKGQDSSNLGNDSSGNNNDFTSSGLTAADQVSDSPTDNYATLNPLLKHGSVTLADGNLEASSSTNGWFGSVGTVGIRLGDKVYFEGKCLTNVRLIFGLSRINGSGGTIKPESDNGFETGQSDTDYMWRVTDANTVYYQTTNQSVTVSAVSVNDIVGCSVDTNGTVKFYKNGTEIHSFSATLVAGDTYMPVYSVNGATSTEKWEVRFGSTGISHQPAGFSLLRTSDMADPTIADPSAYFDTLTWSGDSSNKNITGLNFKPDWLWIKQRNQAFSVGHQLYDVVRGAGSEKELDSSSAAAEGAGNPDVYGYPSAFVSGGFTATAGSSGDWDYVNKSGVTYVAWNWLADNTTGSTNTDGSINSTVSNNSTSNFSIATYTGTGSAATIGHGLGVAPAMVIVKKRDSGTDDAWIIWHQELPGANYYLNFDTGAQDTSVNYWNNTLPTSSVFSVGASNGTNQSSKTFVAYCFAEVEGFSKFGSYTGNGLTDGVFVHTDFEVGFLMYKRTNAAESWEMYDNTRGFNVHKFNLRANLSNAEQSDVRVDLLSNGFKARSSNTAINASGSTYIYMAFASSPFKTATAQ